MAAWVRKGPAHSAEKVVVVEDSAAAAHWQGSRSMITAPCRRWFRGGVVKIRQGARRWERGSRIGRSQVLQGERVVLIPDETASESEMVL